MWKKVSQFSTKLDLNKFQGEIESITFTVETTAPYISNYKSYKVYKQVFSSICGGKEKEPCSVILHLQPPALIYNISEWSGGCLSSLLNNSTD